MIEADVLLEGLRRQWEKYRVLSEIVVQQKSLLAGQDMDALLALIERKRVLMEEVEALEKEISPIKARWQSLRSQLDLERVRSIEEAIGKTREILESIVRLEDEGRALMVQRRDMTAQELKELMTKRRARGAYGNPGSGPRFIDGAK
jgi:flagellar biosynthesis/type III secretory pathway chaperone